jgi:CPA2 family monovalent cation:H+ antiporter-2
MPQHLDLILTLFGGLSAALLFGVLTQRVGLSPIVGYLLAGIAVGPFTPGFVANRAIAEELAEVGVILLMFGVGLQFHLKELLSVRRVAIPGALGQIATATALGVLVAQLFGWGASAGLVFGLAISVASTVVLVRVLSDHRALHTSTGHIAVGWLVVEDIFTVFVLVLLPSLFASGAIASPADIAMAVGVATLKLAALALFTFFFGRTVIPRMLGYVAGTRSRELFTLTVLVLALGIALGSAFVFGASMALGAFLAGMVVGQSEFASRAASEALPLRDAFAVLFFVSVGMLFDPAHVIAAPVLPLLTLAVVLIGKPVAAFAAVLLLGYPIRTGIAVAVALAQIGEFSFILASVGQKLGVLPAIASQSLVAAAIVSITLNPLMFRAVEPVARWATRRIGRPSLLPPPLAATVTATEPPSEDPRDEERRRMRARYRTVVVGYGPVGRVLTELLSENGIEPTVIELNHETVAQLTREGTPSIYGDAAQREILERAGVGTAGSLIFSADGAAPDAAIRYARELNPEITILARAGYTSEIRSLEHAGADTVVSSEAEVALAMAERLLRQLGATGEVLDRVRDRVRDRLAETYLKPEGA